MFIGVPPIKIGCIFKGVPPVKIGLVIYSKRKMVFLMPHI